MKKNNSKYFENTNKYLIVYCCNSIIYDKIIWKDISNIRKEGSERNSGSTHQS